MNYNSCSEISVATSTNGSRTASHSNSLHHESLVEEDSLYDELNTIDRSVSTQNIYDSCNYEDFRNIVKTHIDPYKRNNFFNCRWKIYKKGELIPTVQSYKNGQSLEVVISAIDDSKRFYTQPVTRLDDLAKLDVILEKFVQVNLRENSPNELLTFQQLTVKFDVVLAKAPRDAKWRRAILMDKKTSSHFEHYENVCDYDDSFNADAAAQRKESITYYTFFFIDSGTEHTVRSPQNDKSLFILPMYDSAAALGAYALKCSLNDGGLRVKENQKVTRVTDPLAFERKFKETLLGKRVLMRISSTTRLANEIEAMVELFFLPDEAEKLLANLNETLEADETMRSSWASQSHLSRQQKLSCSHYVLSLMQANNQDENNNYNDADNDDDNNNKMNNSIA